MLLANASEKSWGGLSIELQCYCGAKLLFLVFFSAQLGRTATSLLFTLEFWLSFFEEGGDSFFEVVGGAGFYLDLFFSF